MPSPIRIGAITDEFSPDIRVAAKAMAELGMKTAELRMIGSKNIMDLSDAEVDEARGVLDAHNIKVLGIASPLLKCVLPDAPAVDERFQQDLFASKHTFEDQPRLTKRAFDIAERTGAKIVRVFSYWRTVEPEAVFERVAAALQALAEQAARHNLTIGIENEHACNIATARETARVFDAIADQNLQAVWDPANAYVSGEDAFPTGYGLLPAARLAHVHAKDCRMRQGHQPEWCALGEGDVDWRGQIKALQDAGYDQAIHLETHWGGPGGDKLEGSRICGRNLSRILGASR
jgi:L-ribulose-5-phosphate 3-epimerase